MKNRDVKYIVEGGRELSGEVEVGGAKNGALPLIAASVMLEKPVRIKNVPLITDVFKMCKVVEALGANVKRVDHELYIEPPEKIRPEVPFELGTAMRASFFVLGPVLAKAGYAKVPFPGGCAIGPRPVDLHLKGLRLMGAKITVKEGFVIVEAKRGLKGARIFLDFPSVGATENLMMAAVFADGETVIKNAAKEPEVVELAEFLRKAGASVEGAGTDTIKIRGPANSLKIDSFSVIPDRIEAATFISAVVAAGGKVKIKGVVTDHLTAVVSKFSEMGAKIKLDGTTMEVEAPDRPFPVKVLTFPYPGFPTDDQPLVMACLLKASGTSVIVETVYENRFLHVGEFLKMGAQIDVEGRQAVVVGRDALKGATVIATDLRACAALIVAGLSARGETVVLKGFHVDRGYERFEEKLRKLGASIRRDSMVPPPWEGPGINV